MCRLNTVAQTRHCIFSFGVCTNSKEEPKKLVLNVLWTTSVQQLAKKYAAFIQRSIQVNFSLTITQEAI